MGSRLLLAGSLLASAAAVAAAPATSDKKVLAKLEQLMTALEADDCPRALKIGEPLLGPKSPPLQPDAELFVASVVAECAYVGGDKEKGLAFALRGTRLEQSSDALWRLRLFLQMDAKQYDAAVGTIEEMSRGRGAALNGTPIDWMWSIDRGLRDSSQKALRKRLLRIVGGGLYYPVETAGDSQILQQAYAKLLADEGDIDGARAVLAKVYDPGLIIDSMFDPRLRSLVPADIDLRAVAAKAVATDRETVARHPNRIAPYLSVASNLNRLARSGEALALLQSMAAEIEKPDGFVDRSEMLPWYWNAFGLTYVKLGRYEDAVAAFGKGAQLEEGGVPNVSQVINLAHLHLRFDRPQEALKTLSVFDTPGRGLSGYGEMALRVARGCAHAKVGNKAAAEADLAYGAAHEKDSPAAVMALYDCLGRTDEAAAVLIRRLDDPELRSAALMDLSDYDAPVPPTPNPDRERRDRLKAREDVKAAIARAGGIRRIPLQNIEL